MDKEQERAKSLKLSKQERKVLRSIDKSSKWEDVKAVEELNKEILELDIYKDFIGLGCSRYLNESAEKGSLDIDDMFRNCREAEKVRQRFKKKERREQAKEGRGGKAGLGKGNIGSNVRNEVKPKEVESKQIKESPIVDKARQLSKVLVEGLTNSVKGDDWKSVIAKTGMKYGLEGLFGLVIGVVEYSVENPIGAIAITPAMIGIMSKIYQYVYENETGKKVIGNITDWFNGKLNELIDYLMGKDINVVKKKKKKKPFDRGGGRGPDTDDDDDDDSDSGDFTFDFDELDEYEGKTETKKEAEEEVKKDEQDLRNQQAPPQQEGVVNQILSTLGSQLAQAQTQLVNVNTERLFQQNNKQSNPLPKSDTTTPKTDTTTPQENPEPQENLNPQSSLLRGAGILGAVGSVGLAGISQLNRMFNIGTPIPPPQQPLGPQIDPMGTFNTPAQFRTDTQPLVQPQQPPNPAENNLNNQGQMTDERREQEELLRKQQEDKQKQEEQQKKVNQAIEDQDIRGRAWGLVLGGMSGGGSKTAQANSIIPIYNREQIGTQTDTIGGLLSQEEVEQQQSLFADVERSADEARNNAMKMASENERLQAELSLIRAREGKEPERKMTAEEQDIVKEQEEAEKQAEEQREQKQKQRQTLREQEMERLEREMGEVSMEEEKPKKVVKETGKIRFIKPRPRPPQIPENILSVAGNLAVAGKPPDNAPPLQPVQADANFDIEEAQMTAEEVLRGRPKLKEGETGKQEPNRELVFNVLGLPHLSPRGTHSAPLLYSYFEGEYLNRFDPSIRGQLRDYVSNVRRQARLEGKRTATKLLASQIKDIADIIRRGRN